MPNGKGETWGWIDPWGSVTQPPPTGWEGEIAKGQPMPRREMEGMPPEEGWRSYLGLISYPQFANISWGQFEDKLAWVPDIGAFVFPTGTGAYGSEKLVAFNRMGEAPRALTEREARSGNLPRSGETGYWTGKGYSPWLESAGEPTGPAPDLQAIYERYLRGLRVKNQYVPALTQYYKSQFAPMERRYLLEGGAAEEKPFESWLGGFPWGREYQNIPSRTKGEYPSRFAPSARWFTYG